MGRILSNFILAQKGHPPVIVLDKNKKDYVNALTASHKHRDMTPIVSFFFTTSIKRMKAEIEQKINLTENFFIGIKEENNVNEEKKSFGRKR
jgi:filamentation induced by cAMP protein fic